MSRTRHKLNLTQIEELKQCLIITVNETVRIRCSAVYLYGTGHAVEEVIHAAGCSRTSLMTWSRKYRRSGLDGLRDKRRGGNSAKLTKHQLSELKDRLHSQPTWTVEELQDAVQRWYKVRYSSRTSYYNLFKRCGFKYDTQIKSYVSVLTND